VDDRRDEPYEHVVLELLGGDSLAGAHARGDASREVGRRQILRRVVHLRALGG